MVENKVILKLEAELKNYYINNNINLLGQAEILDKNNKRNIINVIVNKGENKIVSNSNSKFTIINNKLSNLDIEKVEPTLKNQIKLTCLVKIKDYKTSSHLFLYGNRKKSMFESDILYNIENITFNYCCKKDNINRDIVEIHDKETNRNLKFVFDDLDIVFPDFKNLYKGWSKPKDRTITSGKSFKIINNKNIRNIKIGTIGKIDKILEVKGSGNCKYLQVTLENNKIIKLTKKNIKFI